MQGATKVGAAGDKAWNMGTTTCALVLGFYASGEVACFHWPFFIDDPAYFATFDGLVSDQPTNITVVTNAQPSSTHQTYQRTFRLIHDTGYNRQVPINYYTNSDFTGNNDLRVVLGATDIDLTQTNAFYVNAKHRMSLLQQFAAGTAYW